MDLKKTILSVCGISVALITTAQTKQDKEAIKDLCGCFAVTFNYAETFTNDTLHKKYAHPKDNFAVTEYEYPIEETPKKIVIQHLLVIPDGKGTVIKHWREDWEFEQTTLWQYDKDKVWNKVLLRPSDVKGQWTQSVWEVDDAPRYMGSSEWVKTNNELFWLNTTDAPLPRREYTTRHDYNVMSRTSRTIVTDSGYLLIEDNKKIIRKDGSPDSLLAEEKGYNKYVRLPDSECAQAKAFWTQAKSGFWSDVRNVWEAKMQSANKIKLQTKVNDQFLYEALDDVENKNLTGKQRKQAIEQVMDQYIQTS